VTKDFGEMSKFLSYKALSFSSNAKVKDTKCPRDQHVRGLHTIIGSPDSDTPS